MRLVTIISAAAVFSMTALGFAVAIDSQLNGGRIWSAATGRAGVEDACLPELRKTLAQRGFSPSDIEFARQPAAGLPFVEKRSFQSEFTFADGVEQTRVDGVMDCEIGRIETHVVVRTSARPIRAT